MIRRIGSGGEGAVYLVCHIKTDQLRAAKVLINIRENCRHELDMMKNLNHPSLPKVIDILEEGENTWLIMEYIQGCRLDQAVLLGLGKKQLWFVADQLAQVLIYLHGRKNPVLHLDIKPSNILLRPDGRLVLIDFGASIRGHPEKWINPGYGTPGFAAPEQLTEGASVDVRTDLFGAGAVLYYCRYGKTPDSNIGRQKRDSFARVISKCIQKDPEKRYADSREFYRALCRARKSEKKHRLLYECLGAVGLLLLSGVFLFSDLQSGQIQELLFSAEVSVTQKSGYGSIQEADERDDPDKEEGEENFPEQKEETSDVEQTEKKDETGVEKLSESDGETESELDKQEEYNRLLSMAGGLGFVQAVECYRNASLLFPGDGEWYLNMLEQVTSDGLFEESEEEAVKELIYNLLPGGSSTALEFLEENAESYGLVTYRLGLAYWYFYEGSGGKSAAAWWFQKALTAEESQMNEPEDWTATAEILARIGSYYGMLGSTGTDTERLRKEWDYWKDLQQLWEFYRLQEEDEKICCKCAEELLSLLTLHAYILYQNGVSKEAMLGIAADIEEYLSKDFQSVDAAELEKLENMVQNSSAAVERVFQNEKGESQNE
ncbi:MAG: serine/threonine protein kinase [Clostridiales bacterium]|nr:serine/threonine protein kinase [Clostridiales bacterium]